MNKIILKSIQTSGKRVEINYKVEGKIRKFFREETFWMEFQENMEDVPEGILIIPFLGDVLPLVWVTDSKLVIDKIDKTFYESIQNIKKGYENMYPEMKFLGELEVKNVVDYSYEPQKKSCQFFSGGIDSTATLISRMEEKPDLITMWGADISIDNIKGWSVFQKFIKSCGERHDLKNIFIKSNYRKIYSTHKLNKIYEEVAKANWWLGFQHGLALICIGVVYAYKHKIETIYIPASWDYLTPNDKRCSSSPSIDEAVKFCGRGNVIHEGVKYSREDKVDLIVDYAKKTKEKLKLRVCWEGDEGNNCNYCHKCLKAIVTFILAGADPNDYGFNIEKKDLKERIVNSKIVPTPGWEILKNKYNLDKKKWENDPDMKWLGTLDIEGQRERNLKRRKNFFIKMYRKIEKKFKNYM
ncbi:hypothetical protein [Fusobacterium sp. MFO224]|uniref:hypothetical protein n=1 Tax=Fusobacterium sp. MFO224 TaxID=3378070 RepID=UPI0038521032